MLQNLRKHAQGWIAVVIATILCLAFALWGIEYYLEGGPSQQIVAEVDEEEITEQDWEYSYKRLLRQQNLESDLILLNEAKEKNLKNEALQQLVLQSVLSQSASRVGFEVSNNQVNMLIAQIPGFQENGNFSLTRFQQFVSDFFPSQESFVENLKKEILVLQARLGIINSAFALPNELDQAITLLEQKRDFDYLRIPVERFLKTINISATAINDYYKSHPQEFMKPEEVRIQYIDFSPSQIESKISFTDADLEQYYQENLASFSTPEKWQIGHIVIKLPKDADEKQVHATQIKMDDVVKKLQSGQDFARLALEYSDDKATAISGGIIGWVDRAQIAPAVMESLVKLQPGQVTTPLRTDEGLELMKLFDVKKAEVLPLQAVRKQVENNIRQQKIEQILADQGEQLADLTYTNPDTLKVAADALKLPIKTTDFFPRTGGKSGLAANPKIVTIAFSDNIFKQRNNSNLIPVNNQNFVVLRVEDYHPAALLPLSEVNAIILEKLKVQASRKAAQLSGEKVLGDIKRGVPLDKISQQNQLVWNRNVHVGRKLSTIPQELLDSVFSLPAPHTGANPSLGGAAMKDGSYVVIALNKVEDGNPASFDKAQREALRNEMAAQFGSLDYELYVKQQMEQAKIEYQEK